MELAKRLRTISLEDAKESYQTLTEQPCKKPGFDRIGIQALDYFFLHHRLKAKVKHISFFEAMKDPEMVEKLKGLVVKYKKKALTNFDDPDGLLKAQYSVFQLYYGSINQFRPTVARWVYCSLGAKKGILDFSAGWGGRCLAAMSLDIPYIGCDANTKLESSYKQMVNTYKPGALGSSVKLFFQPSETVDFSKFTYDLIFTSPPYFMIEEYERMPAYKSKEGFLQKFFVPVVQNSWKHLAKGGHMALNMPHDMYVAVKDILPKVTKKLTLTLRNRHPTNAVKGRALGTETERHELIYVWKKTSSTQTRKKKKT